MSGPPPSATRTDSGKNRAASLLRLATTASVATAVVLILVKLGAWLITGSVAVLASLIDSLLDAVASVINLVAVRLSLTPADAEHRFGHGKAEYIAGLAQSTFVGGSAILLILLSVDRLMHPRPVEDIGVGIGVMVFSILATLILLLIQRHVIRETGSVAIQADSLHYATDFMTNISIVVALVLAAYGWPGADPVFAIGIAIYILWGSWHIGYESVQQLMDRELPEELTTRVREIALAHDAVLGVHELRTRSSGRMQFIQLHLEMEADIPLHAAHEVADQIERQIHEVLPGADVIIHEDPFDPQRIR